MEWSTFALSGKPTYTELCWLLAMMFGNPSPAASGVAVKTRTYDMADTALLAPTTATIMKGSSVRAQKLAYGLLHDLGMTFSRSAGLTLTGAGIGQLFTDGITMTASPVDVPLVPIVGKHLDFYIDATGAALGTTKMLRAFHVEPSLTGVYGPIWPINSANASFGAAIDLPPTTGVKITMEADAAGMAYLSQFRADTTIFCRLLATGPLMAADAVAYSLTYDVALGIKSVSPDEDESGVTVVTFETEMTKDPTWGKALEIKVVNDVAAVA